MKRVKYLLFLLPVITLLFVSLRPVYGAVGETETFEVTKDTYANQAYPDKINGNYNHIIISNKHTTRLGYIQFQDIDLPEGAIFDKGTLKLYVFEPHYADTAKVNIGPVTGDWEENSLTWNDKPTINQTQAIEAEISLADSGWREIAITHLVRQWFEGTLENKGLFVYPLGYLYGTAETDFAFSIKSKEAENKAQIEVEYHFAPSPSPSPTSSPSVSPSPEVSPSPDSDEEEFVSSPVSEESPSPSPEPEEEEKGLILGTLSLGQAIIAGLIILALIGSGIAFLAYARKKPTEKPKKKKEPQEEEKKEENSS